ncbi:MAG: DUF58 domain-containing protein [Deltaproteobacteria bacterium]|jgi:uncharacterized protein (DUF58 family)|nr:DUF58 domain-containing protein [Deltaproteobacteria bacterium]MBW2536306.1 DUF58 domain-containing protein [Deltaproteobacteria bacterium]
MASPSRTPKPKRSPWRPKLAGRPSLFPPSPAAKKRKKSFWPRKLKFTREGKYFLGITLGVGLAAINTGNNLLYLLLGMMLSLIIVSGVMSELSLRTLRVKRRLPTRAQVGRSHLVEIEVFNNKRRVPSYAIEVEDLRADQPADKRCFFLKISPRSTQIAAYRRTPQRRGLERHTGFRIATRFPFGLFEKSREVENADELIIYPAVDPVRLPPRGQGENAGESGPLGRGSGEEIFALRPMREGDDPRDIYWRKSTRPDGLVLRERAREVHQAVEFVVDVLRTPVMGGRDGPATPTGEDRHEVLERHIRRVASHAVAHIKRGDRVTIVTTAGERVRSDLARGIDPLLRFLALLELVDAPPAPGRGRTNTLGRAA